ncbi:MAG: DUF4367 domain-containing protein, partial [Clostridia bacterium]|nr:DUF4367 domain-containing protein [Clostridia bacterium]
TTTVITEEYEFSDSFKKSMDKLILKQQKATWKMTNTTPKRMAVLAAVIALLVAGTMSVSAVREPVLKIITEIFDTHIDLNFEGQTTTVITEEYELTWLPEGFEVAGKMKNKKTIHTEYKNDGGDIIHFMQHSSENRNIIVDNEHGNLNRVNVDGIDMMIRTSENSSFVIWEKNGYIYTLQYIGNESEKTLIKIAESISTEKK